MHHVELMYVPPSRRGSAATVNPRHNKQHPSVASLATEWSHDGMLQSSGGLKHFGELLSMLAVVRRTPVKGLCN